MGQPLVRGVLIDQHQRTIAGDRDYVGVEHLRHRRTERMFGARFGRGSMRAAGATPNASGVSAMPGSGTELYGTG